jgi:hypothetical protein
MFRFVSFAILFLATTISTTAQSNLNPREVRVQVSVNYSVPGPFGDGDEAAKAQETARRALYGVADRECVVLKETIATECRLEAMNVNVNRQRHSQQDMITVGSSMTFRVMLK